MLTKTTNQQIYSEIRGLMDDAATNYRKQQEYNKKKEEYINSVNAKKKNIMEQANQKLKEQKAIQIDANTDAISTKINSVI